MLRSEHELIETMYACATGEVPWEHALRPIMDRLNARCAGIVKHSIAPVKAEVLVGIDVEPATQQAYIDRYVRENPLMNCLSAMPLGFVTAGSGVVDERFYAESAFYNDWQKPAGYADNMGISLARRGGEFVLLSLPRDFDHGVYTKEELDGVKPFVQHLVRAFNIWLRLSAAESEAGWVSEALDQMPQGLVILGEGRVILYANRAGERILSSNEGLARRSFRIHADDREAAARMDGILRLFETGEAEETREYGFAIPRGQDRPALFVRVQPPLGLKPGQRQYGLPKAIAFLHLVDPEARDIGDPALFCQAYGLTPAETRLVGALLRTESVVESARMLGTSEATVRTHMQHIYAKTGARNFASLVALIHRSLR